MSDMRLRSALVVGAVLVSAAVSLWAQSLADVARKEEERRKAIAQPAKVYTNKDLNVPPESSIPASPAPASPDTNADAAKSADKDKGDPGKDGKDAKDTKDADKAPVKDQKYWSGRFKDLQTQFDRDQSFADALQNKINSLTTDFVNRDDPAQRATIERDRQKSLAEVTRLKKAIDDDKKAIADLQEEARRAGVPPGWLR